MQAVIMAGGFGTRLRPLSCNIPKPMVPMANRPMLAHIIDLLKKHGFNDMTMMLYFQPEVITNYFGDGDNFGVKLRYHKPESDLGTAGSVKYAQKHLTNTFVVISGDVLTDLDLTKAIEYHKKKKAIATMILTRVANPLQYGVVITEPDGKIERFLEKPSWGEVFSDTINTGIYILEPDVLDLIPYHEEFDFSKDLFPLMLRQNMPLYGHITDGYWKDIGNLNEYQSGQKDALNGEVNLKIKGITKANYIIGENTKIAATAVLKGTVIIDNGVTIGEHATLINCIIGKNVSIGNGSKLSGVTLWENVKIGDFAELTDDVVCNDCYIGDNATIHENVFIAENCRIGDNATLMSNIKLWPNKHIEEGATLSRSMVQEEKWIRELCTDARISGLSNIEINPEFGAKLGAAIGMTF